ncbi:MAG: outer membrane protein [Syntrophothermus sp.]
MKKYFLLLVIPFLVTIFSVNTNAQSFQLGAGIGYSIPSGDFGGETPGFYNGTEYGMGGAFNVHAKARLGLVFMNVFGEVGYNFYSGEGNAEVNKGNLKVTNNVLSIKVGPEYSISIPMSPISPYVQGFIAYNSFSGKVNLNGVSSVPSGEYDIESASRIGLGLGAGVLFKLAGLNLDLNVQYNMMNLFSKEFTTQGTSHPILDNFTALNDEKDPLYAVGNSEHFIGDSRNISAIELKLSVLFGL